MNIFLQPLLISLFLTALLFPQEKIIILNKKVGERIEKQDALKYHLFQSINNLESAVIKQKDSLYYADVELWRMGRIVDSSFSLSYGSIMNMAKLIEYGAEVNRGNYDLNNFEVQLFYSDGTPVQYTLDSLAFVNSNNSKKFISQKKHSGLLPFINDPDRVKFKTSIRWGAGIGISTYPVNISESEFRQKLGITNLTSKDDPGILFLFSGFLEWKFIGLEFEYAGNSEYSKINVGTDYLFKGLLNDFITPFAGFSISFLKFSRGYDSGDSILVSPGYKDRLLGVDIHNNTMGYNLTAGITIEGGDVALSLSAAHTWVSKKRGIENAEVLLIDLSGFYFEAMLKVYFGEY